MEAVPSKSGRPYLVLFEQRPGINLQAIDDIIAVTIGPSGAQMRISPILEGSADSMYQKGLRYRVIINATNIEEAVDEARIHVELFSEMACFSALVGLDFPKLILVYDFSDGAIDRDFIQVFSDATSSDFASRRILPVNYMLRVLSGLSIVNEEDKETVIRSLKWLRNGMLETDILDRFLCYWVSFENLEGLLKKKAGLIPRKRICQKCKAEQDGPTKTSGIPLIFCMVHPEDEELYWTLSGLRNDIAHGNLPTAVLVEKCTKSEPILLGCLLSAFHFLADVVGDPVEKDPVIVRDTINLMLVGKIHGFNIPELGKEDKDPRFRLELKSTELVCKSKCGTFDLKYGIDSNLSSPSHATIERLVPMTSAKDVTINQVRIGKD